MLCSHDDRDDKNVPQCISSFLKDIVAVTFHLQSTLSSVLCNVCNNMHTRMVHVSAAKAINKDINKDINKLQYNMNMI